MMLEQAHQGKVSTVLKWHYSTIALTRCTEAPEGVDDVTVKDGHSQVEQAHGAQQHHAQNCAQLLQRRLRPRVCHRRYQQRVPAAPAVLTSMRCARAAHESFPIGHTAVLPRLPTSIVIGAGSLRPGSCTQTTMRHAHESILLYIKAPHAHQGHRR